jgi:7-carboxy-7-deazaguanine synthase
MSFDGLLITEIFHSLQGETSLTGVPFAFIRLTGCNLRCTYCDSSYSFKGGTRLRLCEVIDRIRPYSVRHVLLTGGEPLLQRQTVALIHALRTENYEVSIETHGEVSIEAVAPLARIVMDIKTPSSGMSRGGFRKNLKYLKPTDEVKFVIGTEEDYEFARAIVHEKVIPTHEILLSPAIKALGSPGEVSGEMTLPLLAKYILRDRLPVRLQIQLHKLIWGESVKGV